MKNDVKRADQWKLTYAYHRPIFLSRTYIFPSKDYKSKKNSFHGVKVEAVLVSRGQYVNQSTTYHVSHKL